VIPVHCIFQAAQLILVLYPTYTAMRLESSSTATKVFRSTIGMSPLIILIVTSRRLEKTSLDVSLRGWWKMPQVECVRSPLSLVQIQSDSIEAELEFRVPFHRQADIKEVILLSTGLDVLSCMAFEPSKIRRVMEFGAVRCGAKLALENGDWVE